MNPSNESIDSEKTDVTEENEQKDFDSNLESETDITKVTKENDSVSSLEIIDNDSIGVSLSCDSVFDETRTETEENSAGWLEDFLFGKHAGIWLNDQDVITRQESELRIIWFMIVVSLLSALILISQLLLISNFVIPHRPLVIQPSIAKESAKG